MDEPNTNEPLKIEDLKVCPRCGVRICGSKVLFSAGPVGTLGRLWARVCNNVKKQDLELKALGEDPKPACINTAFDTIEAKAKIKPEDFYGL